MKKPTILNTREVADEIYREDMLNNITYVEDEGPHTTRIDYWGGERSLWLYSTGDTFITANRYSKPLEAFLKSKGFTGLNHD